MPGSPKRWPAVDSDRGYTLSRKAEEDIIAIFLDGARQFGLQQAEQYHDLLERTFQFLAVNPLAARERPELGPPVRIHRIKSHIVIDIIDAAGGLFIIRVRHGHEDWTKSAD
ncbi:type II toxin-antitoxin system RelE/ParE family toxin [Sulfurivermis fontis]|uniref:type II toxin-antitoxin system RelE/ParE family toxin n=1 Tax=Sulfurivermis fontis TaxID=1972068 RepID=UPI000FD9581C|nr:type II toxin-antitoxin system RelE/ParE family toxin [Sulfurivermis fontis]